MFFDAGKTQGAIGAVIPEKSAHSTGPGQEHNLSPEQFPGKGGGPADAGAEAGAEGAAAGGAEAGAAGAAGGAAGLADLAPLLLL